MFFFLPCRGTTGHEGKFSDAGTHENLLAPSLCCRGMIELFPAKCRDENLRCRGSVWAGIVMKHHNIVSERSKHWPAVSFCVLPYVTSAPSVNTIPQNEVYQTQFCEEVTVILLENAGKVTKW
jgi:hypothetical protein